MIDLFKDDCQILKEESFDDFILRYNGFGKEIYGEIKLKIPDIFEKIKLYKAIKSTGKCAGYFPQTLDSYAHYYSKNLAFRIYLDPECEVIGIHNDYLLFETGFWSKSPSMEIINFIKNEIMSS